MINTNMDNNEAWAHVLNQILGCYGWDKIDSLLTFDGKPGPLISEEARTGYLWNMYFSILVNAPGVLYSSYVEMDKLL